MTSAGPAGGRDSAIGNTLVDLGRLSRLQLDRCERIRDKLGGRRSLESILVEKGYLYRRDLRGIFAKLGRPLPLGALLIERGVLTPEAVDEALCVQAQLAQTGQRSRIGEILCQRFALPERALLDGLAEQSGLTVLSVDKRLLDRALMARLPLALMRSSFILPYFEAPAAVCVLFAEPPDAALLSELERALGRKVTAALAERERITAALAADGQVMVRARAAAGPPGIVTLLDQLLDEAAHLGASDIHFEPMRDRLRIRLRIDGELETSCEWPKDIASQLVARIKVLSECDLAEHRKHQDGRFARRSSEGDVDYRVSVYSSLHGESVVIRLLRRVTGILRLEELGMAPEVLRRFRDEVLVTPTGVVLVTGPTGAGKTSTLYSAIAAGNRANVKMITVEDPIEFALDGVVQCQINAKIGQNFTESLRAIVRQDPDVIVLGEIRDAASAEVAIHAALTGHKVYSTLHTEDAVGGLLRLNELDIEPFLVASTLVAVVAQRLLRRCCIECAAPDEPTAAEIAWFGLPPDAFEGLPLQRGAGCSHCRGTGFRGRIGVYEILIIDDELKQAVIDRLPSSEIRRRALASGNLYTMQESGVAQVARGVTTLSEVQGSLPQLSIGRPLAEIMTKLGYTR